VIGALRTFSHCAYLLACDRRQLGRIVWTKMRQCDLVTDMPGFRLHPLKGALKGFWAVTVRANRRVIFRFADHDATDVDYVDYH